MKDIRFINDSKTTYINEVRVMDGNITHTVPVIRCAAYRDEKWISHFYQIGWGECRDIWQPELKLLTGR